MVTDPGIAVNLAYKTPGQNSPVESLGKSCTGEGNQNQQQYFLHPEIFYKSMKSSLFTFNFAVICIVVAENEHVFLKFNNLLIFAGLEPVSCCGCHQGVKKPVLSLCPSCLLHDSSCKIF
jgi:hypothetical protein